MFAQDLCVYSEAARAQLVSALFESMAEPLLLCDVGLSILAVNKAAADLLRAPLETLAGRRAHDVLPVQSSEGVNHALRRRTNLEWRSVVGPQSDPSEIEVRGTALSGTDTAMAGWVLRLRLASKVREVPEFIGSAAATLELLEFVSRIAVSRASSILLMGESGTGKDLIARRIHALSPRAGFAFVPINCAALPENLLESELFGYEKGAFTNASQTKPGLLEVADGGTVFLDEIGELPLPMQAKLLRAVEDHTFRRIGGSRNISADLRFICATNVDLEEAIQERQFRSDLYYRLNGVQIRLPALRERMEDIAALSVHLLKHFNRVHDRQVQAIHPATQRLLDSHPWPGNIRELRNVIERGVLVETSPLLTPASVRLHGSVENSGLRLAVTEIQTPPAAPYSLRTSEFELVTAALKRSHGNQVRAAALLGISRFSLRYKMKKLGLLPPP